VYTDRRRGDDYGSLTRTKYFVTRKNVLEIILIRPWVHENEVDDLNGFSKSHFLTQLDILDGHTYLCQYPPVNNLWFACV
jgi:hypothetical protein